MTIPYYNQNGKDFFDRTVNLDLTNLYDAYADLLPKDAHILDAGCGSGRDSKIFLQRGYTVSAFDGSETMVKLAHEYTGLDVKQMTFANIAFDKRFDGVWANASLLHLPYRKLPQAFDNLAAVLKKHGIFYVSFKEGRGENTTENGRHFTYFTEARLRDFIAQFPNLLIEKVMHTPDDREDKPPWVNVYMRRMD
ncbi:MAG: class I SAM-dependent methyltransferase [Chloroflexota bacterium]